MEPKEMDRYARTHLGLVTYEHATERGITRSGWNQAIARGAAERLHRNVVRLYGAPTAIEQQILAAVLAAGEGAMASHRSSTRVWGAERPDRDPIDLILPGRNRRARLDGVVVHRPRDLADLRPVMRGPIPTTNPLRTLLDLGAVDPSGVPAAVRAFVLAGFVTPGSIGAAIVRHAQRGRAGIAALRSAVEQWHLDSKPADSELEIQMQALAERFALPAMEFHPVLAGHEVDFRVSGTPIVVECDGWTTHGVDRDQFEHDRVRDAEITALGNVVLRVSSRAIFRTPGAVAHRIGRAVWAWAPEVAAATLALHPRSVLGATGVT
jgi:very-short-patch-repair endonuclease